MKYTTEKKPVEPYLARGSPRRCRVDGCWMDGAYLEGIHVVHVVRPSVKCVL